MNVKNNKKIIIAFLIFFLAVGIAVLLRATVFGALTENGPKDSELTNGLVGYWTFDGPDTVIGNGGRNSYVTYPQTGSTSTAGTLHWANPQNITTASDNVRATVTLSSTAQSEYLRASNFGFNIPANATIVGVIGDIQRIRTGGSTGNARDYNVVLFNQNGSPVGNNKAYTGTNWPTTEGWACSGPGCYGSSSDTWGVALTPTIVNSPNFGMGLQVTGTSGTNRVAGVDAMDLEIYYTIPPVPATALDVSGNGNTGTFDCADTARNCATAALGKLGQGINFGTAGSVDVGNIAQTNSQTQMSWSFWVYQTQYNSGAYYISKANPNTQTQMSWAIMNEPSSWDGSPDGIGILISPTLTSDWDTVLCISQDAKILLNQWMHVVAVYDGSQSPDNRLKIYTNDVMHPLPVSTTCNGGNPPTSTTNSTSDVVIGDAADSTRNMNNTTIDDVRIYNRVLSDDEVKRLYLMGHSLIMNKSPRPGDGPASSVVSNGLLGYWTFDGKDTSLNNTLGETHILSGDDSGNANYLQAQSATLSSPATLQSLSFYVNQAAGNLRLGLYDATGPSGGPGNLLASTTEITPVVGWNTANVVTPVALSTGTYWLANFPNNNNLHYPVDRTIGSTAYYNTAYGPLPATFSTTPTYSAGHWSVYGTLTGAANDVSGQGNGLGLTGFSSTSTVFGKIGQGLKFDGTSNSLQTASPFNANSSIITVSYWSKWTAFTGVQLLMELSPDFNSYSNTFLIAPCDSTTNQYSFAISSGDYHYLVKTLPSYPSAGVWHHYVVIFDNSTTAGNIQAWVDGISQTLTTWNNDKDTSGNFTTDTLYFMSRAGSSLFTAGSLDDVRVYSRALSADEIRQLYLMGGSMVMNKSPRPGDGPASSVVSNGLVGYWTFDGKDTNWATGKTYDVSGQGNTGDLAAGFATSSAVFGKIGQGLKFDGVDSKVSLPSNVANVVGTGPVTVAAWIYPKSLGGGGYGMIFCHDEFWFQLAGPNQLILYSDNPGVSSGNDITFNRWNHVVFTRTDAGISNFYINGILSGAANQNNGTPLAGFSNSYIGSRDDGVYPFDGTIDDVRVYNRVLSADEVRQLYLMGG